MNGKDRDYFEERFDRLESHMSRNSIAIARLQEKWKMMEKFAALISGIIALITTVVLKTLWR